uniref:Plexin-A4 n=2 Tax=Saccoglossus kowalevskii TaxID=10224 RepID=A0ABM0MJ89_SACKO|nr:PREDICTED: plexin-A4 [Saccoglossus kowalevskii]
MGRNTSAQITKVPVENCEKYTTCDECLGVDGVGDPYCGWCTLENRCTRKSDCEGYPDSSTNRWIADDSQCPSIDVDPSSVEREKIKLLTLTVTSLPHSRNGYKCVFDSLGTTDADAADESNVLTCTTPPPSNIPPPGNRGYVRVKLSLLSKETNEKFVSTDFDFYDCESFKTCMTCTKNNYGCDWCVFENKCSKDVSSCIENGIIKGDAIEANSSQQCPQIKEGAETLIPVDLSQEFYVVGVNFPQPSDGQTGYDCILHIEGVEVTVTGERESTESIKCQSSKYMYSEDVSSKLVSLQLKWNNDFEIDNPDNVKVNLYKCDVGRPNCGVCHQAELKYQCGWCNSVNEQKCTVVNKCNPINSWLTREEICPNPTIDKIKPEAGPIEGGTRLTIMGYNLGKNSSNVKQIDVAGLECIPQSDGYRTAEHGGTKIVVTGENLNIVQTTLMRVYKDVLYYDSPCKVESSTKMVCKAPDISATNIETTAEQPYKVDYGFILDSVENTTHLINSEFGAFSYYPNPEYYPFENGVKVYSGVGEDPLVIPGQHLNLASSETDVTVMIGSEICEVISLAWNQLTCQPPRQQPNGGSEEKGVELWIYHGNLNVTTGSLKYASAGPPLSIEAIIAIAAAGTVCLVVFIIILILYRRKSTESNRNVKKLQVQLDMLESRVAKECKEAFAELQTEVTEMTTDIEAAGIPFLDYRNYTMKVLFPGDEDHPVLKELEVKGARKADVEKGLREFGKLINNKTFLLIFIRTLEAQNNFKMTESVAEKMLTNWLTFMLYRFLKDCAGEPLFMLYRALKQQIEKGPVDACTHEARYSLSEAKLIRQQIDYKTYLINVVNPDTVFDSKEEQYIQVKVLDCDTISQVKEKFLDAIYKNAPYSSRPRVEQVDLEWRQGFGGRLSLADDDVTCKVEGEWKRINTLEHYKVLDSAIMALVPKQGFNMSPGVTSLKVCNIVYDSLFLFTGNMSLTASPGHRSNSSMLINSEIAESGQKFWHLIKQHDVDLQKEGDRSSKMMSEIYLTRLLSTKGTLQKYVDDFLETLFSTVHHGHALPQAIKYLFDFLDEQALEHGITDPDVVHTWKSNSLPLRFWVNVIKNPDFVFDVYKSQTVDACLSVVAQTFMDSCSTSEHKLGKDSPSSKLLYARDIPHYRDWVYRYYEDIKNMPTVSDQDMSSALADESRVHQFEFNTVSALNELYFYFTHKYNDQILEALEDDDTARKSRLAYKLEQVGDIMSGQH